MYRMSGRYSVKRWEKAIWPFPIPSNDCLHLIAIYETEVDVRAIQWGHQVNNVLKHNSFDVGVCWKITARIVNIMNKYVNNAALRNWPDDRFTIATKKLMEEIKSLHTMIAHSISTVFCVFQSNRFAFDRIFLADFVRSAFININNFFATVRR